MAGLRVTPEQLRQVSPQYEAAERAIASSFGSQ